MPRSPVVPLLVLVLLAPALAACGLATSIAGVPETSIPDGGSGNAEAPSPGEEAWALEVLDRVNAQRQAQGLDPVAWHPVAADVAYAHAWDMDRRGFFDHENPDGQGPGARLTDAGVSWWSAGENIARGQADPGEVMDDWMNSPGHRANILEPTFSHLGSGVHSGPREGPWWVQVFLQPR
jgi:uncharacterized protein YkwD